MIRRSPHLNLGLDHTRIKDPKDAERQEATVDAVLERMFHPVLDHRRELQIVADEVGMGKTFVALATAYSILENMRDPDARADDYKYCERKVVIITPPNSALFAKWGREVNEFVKRCVLPDYRREARQWFAPQMVDRLDTLAAVMNRKGRGPRVIVTSMSLFGSKFTDYDLKRRVLLGSLFRLWGKRFGLDDRARLLLGAPEGWPTNAKELTRLTDREASRLPLSPDEIYRGLKKLAKDRSSDLVERTLDECKELAERYTRNRGEKFRKIEHALNLTYRGVIEKLITKRLPLIIVDEAHNWKNGPRYGTNGYTDFARFMAPRCRRALLLTATPFQLRPDEVLEIMKVSDAMRPGVAVEAADIRRQELRRLREDVIRPVLDNGAKASRNFARAWSKLPATASVDEIASIWASPDFDRAREQLGHVANELGVVDEPRMGAIIDAAIGGKDPAIRALLREGLRLYTYNADLSQELGTFVIRHRRGVNHRRVSVGHEYGKTNGQRSDQHILHASPGLDVRGAGELPHYLLMRCVSEMKKGQGRTALGCNLTGCYSTLLHSAEGTQIKDKLGESAAGKVYLNLLLSLVSEDQDAAHPKVKAVVDEALEAWHNGEKTLIFCFRANTAQRIRALIDQRIREELDKRKAACLGSPEALTTLRGRLTARDRDLIPIALDRVLWSLRHNLLETQAGAPSPDAFLLADDELGDLAALGLRYGIDLTGDRIDRVFLHRALEHLVAKRLVNAVDGPVWYNAALRRMAEENWVSAPYGVVQQTDDDSGDDSAAFDERGVHVVYDATHDPSPEEIAGTTSQLIDRRERAKRSGQVSVFDTYAQGPSLWLGVQPAAGHPSWAVQEVHRQLFGIMELDNKPDWRARLFTFQALRRALLRESVLLRLLPTKSDREESAWDELLVEHFYRPLPNQRESMADKVAVFLEDINAASGGFDDTTSQRFVLYDSTKLRDTQFVALVGAGSASDKDTRNRVFTGFNTPLLPEVLVCTSVGQEGIDLHRHCRHVVHYDLAWNPAVIEQRTGRVDRIGSKTFRERAYDRPGDPTYLEVGVPFLAGTYDERMYEELRLRAQIFEVLTGGDLATDNAEGADEEPNAEGQERALRLHNLPPSMVDDLRVRLEVWRVNGQFEPARAIPENLGQGPQHSNA